MTSFNLEHRALVEAILIETAAKPGELISYPAIAERMGIETDRYTIHNKLSSTILKDITDKAMIGHTLETVTPLSALAVGKGSGVPGPGFWVALGMQRVSKAKKHAWWMRCVVRLHVKYGLQQATQ